MLTQYRLTLTADRPCSPEPEWAYRLYAALLKAAPEDFSRRVHENEITPVSQYLDCTGREPVWTVNLLGEESERALSSVMETAENFSVGNRCPTNQAILKVKDRSFVSIPDAESLLNMGSRAENIHALTFLTATAFKSRKQYVAFPSTRLILQNLINKWNGCITQCPVEIDDGGLDSLTEGLRIAHFQLADCAYHLHGSSVHGFMGRLTLENGCSGFHREFVNALMIFAEYSGIGIKTALGMGGVTRKSIPERKEVSRCE